MTEADVSGSEEDVADWRTADASVRIKRRRRDMGFEESTSFKAESPNSVNKIIVLLLY
jgi:hypothetical protein